MLFGTLIFIKKSGGDGSKFPVTNKSLKIGRSDECVIRIQNPLISPEHCQLTVDDNGQAKIRNLSSTNPTILNDQPLGNGEFVLHQGDVFKIGERFARWEYQPSSKYYHQPSTSSQRLVAVVPPQERVSDKIGSEGNPTVSFNQALKRRYSERVSNSGNESVKKTVRRSLGAGRVVPNKAMLISRHSLQLKRLAFSPQVKIRKLTNLESSGTPNATSGNKTPLRRSSTWEVKTVTPEKGKSPQIIGTNRKSTPIKMPVTQLSNETLIRSTMRSASKIPNLLTITETSPTTAKMSTTRPLDEVPENLNLSPKSSIKIAKTPTPKTIKLMSPRKSLSRSNKKKSFSQSMVMDGVQVLPHVGDTAKTRRTSRKFTPSEKATLRKSVLKKSASETDLEGQDEKGTPKQLPGTPKRKSSIQPIVEISRTVQKVEQSKEIMSETPQRTTVKSERKSRIDLSTSTPPLTPKYSERLSSKKSIPSGVLSTPKEKESVKVSPRAKSASNRKIGGAAATKTPPKRGTKREFSDVASAERAAKKLKTIAPTKPDKNKKAALLVLGKATRKLKAIQNTNVVIKQKIVKKAIKLSTKSKKRVKQVKKASPKASPPKKGAIQDNRKSPVSSTESLTSARRHSTPIGKTPTKNTSPPKTPASTPGRRSGKDLSSPVLDQASNSEIFNSSVPSKASHLETDTISPNSEGICFQYNSQGVYDPSRRVSKRFSSQNVGSRPDFTELTPTALGLTPKSILPEFKSPKPAPRRSSSLVTPKNKVTPSVLKSASTSKIYRKSVRFSGKDFNDYSFSDMNATSETVFDFDEIRTPNVTIDRFISPLSNQKTPKVQLKSPSSVVKSIQRDILHSDTGTPNKSNDVKISLETRSQRSPEQLKKTQKPQRSPTNDLTDVRGVKQLLGSPRSRKSPKNDLTDVRGVKQLLGSPRPRKSPKNDLTDVRGVKQLLGSPRPRKSPKNDLTDVRGVKQLLGSPRPRKSPKNDLTDVRGVKQLLESPRRRKSPRNDLTDVTGVKQLLITKSPSNDLTNVSGLETLFKSPPNKIQCLRTLYNPVSKSPKNDLSNVSGVRQLFSVNEEINNLDVSLTGVAELFLSPKTSDSPKNRTREATSTATAAKISRTSSVQSMDNKPALRGTTRSATKSSRTSRAAAVQSTIISDEESPKVVKRATRNARATKPEKPAETKPTRTKSEVEVREDGIAEKTSSRSTRVTRKRPIETLKSPTPVKRTRKVTLAEEKPATPSKTSKTKKEPAKGATPESKPSPIRTRRKSMAVQSPKTVKRSTRAKAGESVEEESRPKTKAKTIKGTKNVSPVKTRQRKVKEASPAKKETKSSPVRTRRRAK